MLSVIARSCPLRQLSVKQAQCMSANIMRNLRTSSLVTPNTGLILRPVTLTSTPTRMISLTPARMGAVDHSKLWTIERLLAVSLLASLPVAIAIPNPVLDTVAAISIVMHQYWGLEAICNDYVRPAIFGNVIPKATHIALIAVTLATLGGLFYFNYNNVGISNAIRQIWAIKGKQSSEN